MLLFLLDNTTHYVHFLISLQIEDSHNRNFIGCCFFSSFLPSYDSKSSFSDTAVNHRKAIYFRYVFLVLEVELEEKSIRKENGTMMLILERDVCKKAGERESSQEISISRKVCSSGTHQLKFRESCCEVFSSPSEWQEWNWWFELIKVDRMQWKIHTRTANLQTLAFLKPSMKISVWSGSHELGVARVSRGSSEKFAFSVRLPLASAMNCVCAWVRQNQFPRTSLFVFLDKSSSIGKQCMEPFYESRSWSVNWWKLFLVSADIVCLMFELTNLSSLLVSVPVIAINFRDKLNCYLSSWDCCCPGMEMFQLP